MGTLRKYLEDPTNGLCVRANLQPETFREAMRAWARGNDKITLFWTNAHGIAVK